MSISEKNCIHTHAHSECDKWKGGKDINRSNLFLENHTCHLKNQKIKNNNKIVFKKSK